MAGIPTSGGIGQPRGIGQALFGIGLYTPQPPPAVPNVVFRQPIFFQNWTPNPYGVAVTSQPLSGFQGLLQATPPFNNFDQPNPTLNVVNRPAGWVDPLKLNLRSKDKFFGLAGNPNFDWPVPRGPTPSILLRTHIDPLKVNLRSQDTFFGLGGSPQFDWPNPTRAKLPSADLSVWVEGLQVQLQPQFKPPVFDWPNPGSVAFEGNFYNWTVSLNPNLAITPKPFAQTDWPNPLGATGSISLRTWTWSHTFQGQDTFFGLAGNPNFDWPNPGRVVYVGHLYGWTVSLKINLLVPFAQDDWPVPRGATPSILHRTHIDQVRNGLNGAALPGPTNYDWPNPVLGIVRRQDWIDQTQDALNRSALPAPTNYDWPNPTLGIVRRSDWVDQTKNNLNGNALPGPANYDWPNPRGAQRNLDWVAATNIALTTVVTVPFNQYDWPDPRSAAFPIDLRTWIDQVKNNLNANALPGPTNYDWPNPTRDVVRRSDWIAQTNDALTGFVQSPLNQFDWPNPRGPIPVITLGTWIDSVKLALNADARPGPNNYDWPNPPLGKDAAITLRGFTNPLSLTLYGQDTFFGLAGNPNHDWPLPGTTHNNEFGFIGQIPLVIATTPTPPTTQGVQFTVSGPFGDNMETFSQYKGVSAQWSGMSKRTV